MTMAWFSIQGILGLPGGCDIKEFACNAGDPGSIRGLESSLAERHGHPLLPERFHGQRSLVGYTAHEVALATH